MAPAADRIDALGGSADATPHGPEERALLEESLVPADVLDELGRAGEAAGARASAEACQDPGGRLAQPSGAQERRGS